MTVLQVSEVVTFDGATRIEVTLPRPSGAGGCLAVAFLLDDPRAPAMAHVVANLGLPRWRLANSNPITRRNDDGEAPIVGRALYFARVASHPGITHIVAEPANGLPVGGTALCLELDRLRPGAAVQTLSDLVEQLR
jgi:hypothetical protein